MHLQKSVDAELVNYFMLLASVVLSFFQVEM